MGLYFRQPKDINSSWAIRHVYKELQTRILETVSITRVDVMGDLTAFVTTNGCLSWAVVSLITPILMMEAQTVFETMDCNSILT
jgi:hypothetical protein